MGMGPMTGRGAGYCGGAGVPGFANRGFRGGAFAGGRGGRGRRHRFYATGLTGWQRAAMAVPEPPAATDPPQGDSLQQELQMLRTQAEATAATLDQLRQRIEELAASRNPGGESAGQ